MAELLSLICITIVTIQVVRFFSKFIYNYFLAPALGYNVDFKKLGNWAVVTGATDGLGKAYAEALAKKGMDIVLISRTKEKLEVVAEDISKQYNVKTKIIEADFSEGDKIYGNIEKELHNLDIGVLVNNVGLSYPYPEYFLEVKNKEKLYYDILQCNIVSVLAMCQIVMPSMVKQKKGVVINISSATAVIPSPLLLVYGASKMFVSKFSEDLGQEYKKHGITVQCILPGFVATKMSKIKKATFMSPSPKTFVDSALKSVGIQSHTTGYLPHSLLPAVFDLLNFFSRDFASNNVIRTMESVRARAIRNEQRQAESN